MCEKCGLPCPFCDSSELPEEVLPPGALWLRRREEFYERALGPLRQPAVYHFEDGFDPHVDVYVIGRTATRPHETMITGGMADRPLPGVSPGAESPRRVELVLPLPKAEDWAALILREIAALPFLTGEPIGPGHLIQGSRTIRPDSLLRHVLLVSAEEESLSGFVVEGEIVRFLRPCFITEEEHEYATRAGPDALLRKLLAAGASPVLDTARPSLV
jgi:hypothetical protein